MSVGLSEPDQLKSVGGVKLASVHCGLKKNDRDDLVIIQFDSGTVCAATFTRNVFRAAPVLVSVDHLNKKAPRALLINSGNANAGTGERGIADAENSCEILASELGCSADEILPFSTGVIGEHLPMDSMKKGISEAASKLNPDAWLSAAQGIMTTDTVAKAMSKQIDVDGHTITINGIAKGSGMICPDMATMLAFVVTDAAVDPGYLQQSVSEITELSFNAITVDGDTSTNDAFVVAATGAAGNQVINRESENAQIFRDTLLDISQYLAQAIIRDGEGATKFITINVTEAKDEVEAKKVALTVAHSPLVKTAFFASDPNWGRILAAIGRADISSLDIDGVSVFLDDVCIVRDGERDKDYSEENGQSVMNNDEITIRIVLSRGDSSTSIWTTDLSHEYVTINSVYRS